MKRIAKSDVGRIKGQSPKGDLKSSGQKIGQRDKASAEINATNETNKTNQAAFCDAPAKMNSGQADLSGGDKNAVADASTKSTHPSTRTIAGKGAPTPMEKEISKNFGQSLASLAKAAAPSEP